MTLLYLLKSIKWFSIFLKLFVTRINCYFLLGPFASGAALTLIPYIYDPVIKHWLRPDHLEMVRNNIISKIFERKKNYLKNIWKWEKSSSKYLKEIKNYLWNIQKKEKSSPKYLKEIRNISKIIERKKNYL